MRQRSDDLLRGVVRDLAGEARTADGLAARAMAKGRRLLLVRRVGTSLAAVVAVAAVGTPYVLLQHLTAGPPPSIVGPASPSLDGSATPSPSRAAPYPRSSGTTTLPEAAAVPGAADRPDLVGTDPTVLHFDVQLSVVPNLNMSMWRAAPEVESVDIAINSTTGGNPGVSVMVARTEQDARHTIGGASDAPAQVTVHGRPATLQRFVTVGLDPPITTWRLSWQPVDGLWVGIAGRDVADTLVRSVATAVRLDRAQRCVQPLRAGTIPAGTRLTSCHVGISADGRPERDGLACGGTRDSR